MTNPWDEPGVAAAIDKYWETSELEQQWYATLRGALRANMLPGSVLEVGCGSGRVHAILDKPLYVGCDISNEMLTLHGHYIPDTELHLQSDPHVLQFDDKSFDNVLCISVLQHMENPDLLIAELCRVAKKKLIVTTWASHGPTKVFKDEQGFYQNTYNVSAFVDKLMGRELGTGATYGSLMLNNWIFNITYQGA